MKTLLQLLLIASVIFSSSNVFSQLSEVSFNSRVTQSNTILEGKVIEKTSYWDINQYNIYTTNKVEVYKVFKGNLTSSFIEVITPGGTIGFHKETVEPSLSLSIDDVGVFMLKNSLVTLQGKISFPQFEPYASVQGFVKYDQTNNRAVGAFDSFNDIENSLYVEIQNLTNSKYITIKPFIAKLAPTPIAKTTSILSFSPTTVTAGTASTITIYGTDFGTSVGTVRFSDSNTGGASYITGLASDIISWTTTQIVVKVNYRAGTGPIQVVGNGIGTSSQSLTVSYSQLNAIYNPGTGSVSSQTQHIDRDGSGGYVWRMFIGFDASSANAAFVRSLVTWRCNTGINWTIGSPTYTDVIANDNINVVRHDNYFELPAGVLGRCTSRWSSCGGTSYEWYVEELDIVFDDATNWNYSTAAPGNSEYDFESVSLHELGHGHQLGHVINSNDVMHYSIPNGTMRRTLNANNLAGAGDIQSRSTGSVVCGETVMTSYNCIPIADFSGIPTSMCVGSSSTFTDATTNLPTYWAWVFSPSTVTYLSSTTASSQNPVVQFNAAGTYQVQLTATNSNGNNTETKVSYITVSDVPDVPQPISGNIVVCPGATDVAYSIAVVTGATGYTWTVPSGANITWGSDTNSILVDFGTNSGSVIVTPNNSCGNGTSEQLTVSVSDVINPTIACPANQTDSLDGGCNFTIPDYSGMATANDNCGTTTQSQSPVAGTVVGTGLTTITITATDDSSNTAQCTFDVVLSDNTNPTIICPANQTGVIDGNCNFSIPDYTGSAIVSDNCFASPAITQSPAAITNVGIGLTTITLTATDGSGNSTTCSFDVNVTTLATGNQTLTECDGFSITINGNTYTTTGIYTDIFVGAAANGCDSILITDLTVLPALTGSVTTMICEGDSIVVNGTTYNASNLMGTEIFSNIGPNNCDSTVTINITINSIDNTVTNTSPTLFANQAGANYQWLDCNNNFAIIPLATNQTFTSLVNGDYAVEITSGNCIDTSACENVDNVGIHENDFTNEIVIYPNPTNGKVSIDLGDQYKEVSIKISNIAAQLVESKSYQSTENIEFYLKGGKGVYFIEITTDQNSKAIFKLLKL